MTKLCKILSSNDFETFFYESIFYPYKYIWMQIWPLNKKIKSHPRIIIWINLIDLQSLILYTCTKCLVSWFVGSGEGDFRKFFTEPGTCVGWNINQLPVYMQSNNISCPLVKQFTTKIFSKIQTRFSACVTRQYMNKLKLKYNSFGWVSDLLIFLCDIIIWWWCWRVGGWGVEIVGLGRIVVCTGCCFLGLGICKREK